jgi:phospholipase/lecithinase/hemolysin
MGNKSGAIRAAHSVIVSCLLVMLPLSNRTTAKSRFSGIVVFGTSLSDTGNGFALVGEVGTPPDYSLGPQLTPTLPYAKGGHHLSNGATWIEQFARPLGLAGSVRPALQGSGRATNFAVGTARARPIPLNFDLTTQVNTFLLQSGGVAAPDALYVIEMGGADVRDAFEEALRPGGNPGAILQAAVASIVTNIQTLYAAGAREFLVWNVPNVALTPAGRSLGPAAGLVGAMVTETFNDALSLSLSQPPVSTLPGIILERLNAFQLLNDIIANPVAFGFTNVTSACVTPDVPSFECHNPDEFLFWDGIHPTKAGHAVIAQKAVDVLNP